MSDSIRRTQAIAPFGVGAIHVLKGAQAVVTAGLDCWFESPADPRGKEATPSQLSCVRVSEPRLQRQLNVSHFRRPPGPETDLPDSPALSVPVFRFPTWLVCPLCGVMRQSQLSAQGDHTCHRSDCPGAQHHGGTAIMRQVRFVAACENGHLMDFPWREWVHRERSPACPNDLFYKAGGSGSLDDIRIECKCGKWRKLGGIMGGKEDAGQRVTTLSQRLLSGDQPGSNSEPYTCLGGRVWLGEPRGQPCGCHMKAVLINSTNVHYARVASALWIPTALQTATETLRLALDDVRVRQIIKLRRSLKDGDEAIAKDITLKYPDLFTGIEMGAILTALSQQSAPPPSAQEASDTDEANDLEIRIPEYAALQKNHERKVTTDDLVVRRAEIPVSAAQWYRERIAGLHLVDRLKETRALYGFSRLFPQKPPGAPSYQNMMWRSLPATVDDRWLPAAEVYGEGIFIRFQEKPLAVWENRIIKTGYLDSLQTRADVSADASQRNRESVTPRLVMLHTLAHLLIKRLAFECGYGASSLRERLYVNCDPAKPEENMAGLLIYTASGDSEGSLGGLVRMGDPLRFQKILGQAIEDARWCSSDPVCTEIGQNGGQGTDGLNIAACHCCALIAETSCEKFNRFLDRGLVVGTSDVPDLGFFSGAL